MTLARIDGAPPGIKGISLFAVPARRPRGRRARSTTTCSVAGVIHKIGWRGLPSLALNFGETRRLPRLARRASRTGASRYMFQMMNEARIMVGLNGVATASVAYHEALEYARDAPAGPRRRRHATPRAPQVPIIEHADVRRMLLRQKAIVEGGLVAAAAPPRATRTSRSTRDGRGARRARAAAARSAHADRQDASPRRGASRPTRSRVQIHGGYGYSSEYLPEAWLRDQKLNSIHEGTTGIQGLDLLGRKVVAGGRRGAAALRARRSAATVARARAAGVEPAWGEALRARAARRWRELTMELGARGLAGDVERDAAPQRRLPGAVLASSRWRGSGSRRPPRRARALARGRRADADFYEGKLARRSTGSPRSCRAWSTCGAVPLGRGLLRADAARVVSVMA